jgi:hypothetical protein
MVLGFNNARLNSVAIKNFFFKLIIFFSNVIYIEGYLKGIEMTHLRALEILLPLLAKYFHTSL